MSAVPELQDEINRKALDTIQHLILSIHQGKITPHQFSTGVDALWMASSGLFSENIADLVTAAGNEAPVNPAVEKRVFIAGDTVKVVSREVGGDVLMLRVFVNGAETTSSRKDFGNSTSVRNAIIHVAAKLLADGYIEI